VSLLLVGMIYTGTKSLQYLSVPVYTIFKNLTTIVIAYGEVLWFGGSVTPLALLSFALMVFSSVIAAWADAVHAASAHASADAIATLNAGYAWMGMNVICTASYILCMRKVIKTMNFKDWDCKFESARCAFAYPSQQLTFSFSQPCSITTCSPSLSSWSSPSSLKTGLAAT